MSETEPESLAHPIDVSPIRPRRELAILATLAGALVVYFLILAAVSFAGPSAERWLGLTLPNLWLLVAAYVARRLQPGRAEVRRFALERAWAGRRASWGLCLLLGAAVLGVAALAPGGRAAGTAEQVVHGALLITVVPAAEEVFYRGALFGGLRRTFGAGGGRAATALPIAATSLLFGLLHADPVHGLAMAGLSAVLCLAILAWRSLLPAVLLHGAYNAVVVLVELQAGPVRWGVAGASAVGIACLGGRLAASRRRNTEEAVHASE